MREFVAEFKGLTATAKQKAVLAEVDLSRAPLSALVADHDLDHQLVERLLEAMKEHTKPVHPRHLGVIGREHIERHFEHLGIRSDSFDYKKVESLVDGLPQVTEVAFAARDESRRRALITAVNWSASWINQFRRLGPGFGLETVLADRRLGPEEPIILLMHVAHPRVQYSDRGKSSVVVRHADIFKALDSVGQKWTKQRKAEERSRRARDRRDDMWKPQRTSLVEICKENMENAWLLASGNGTLPTHWRQIFYKMRPICERDGRADRPLKDSRFYDIVGDYLERENPSWSSLVMRGARGVFKEAHSGLQLPMSTAAVRGYLSERTPGGQLGAVHVEVPDPRWRRTASERS